MAVYSLKYGYIFFANPQTASKAVARTLERQLEGKALHKQLDPAQRTRLDKRHHLTFEQVAAERLLPADELGRMVRVTGVRNPYDLLVSRYLKHRERFTGEAERYPWVRRENKTGLRDSMAAASAMAFNEWLHARYGDRKRLRGMQQYLDHADVVIRFEAVQADFDALLARLGVTWPVVVERENVTLQREADGPERVKRRYADFYDNASRALVARLFKPVIEQFDYRFDA